MPKKRTNVNGQVVEEASFITICNYELEVFYPFPYLGARIMTLCDWSENVRHELGSINNNVYISHESAEQQEADRSHTSTSTR